MMFTAATRNSLLACLLFLSCLSGCTAKTWVCGNGIVEEGEQCDDANRLDTDKCTNDCQLRINGQRSFYEPSSTAAILEPSSFCAKRDIRDGARRRPSVKVKYRIHLCQKDMQDSASVETIRSVMLDMQMLFRQASFELEEESLVRFSYEGCEPSYEQSAHFTQTILNNTPMGVIPIVFVSRIPTTTNPFPVGGYAQFRRIAVFGDSSKTVVAHELGHFFGLGHTHDCALGQETLGNCANAGDLFCDTSPDRGPRGVSRITRCNDGTEPDGSCDNQGCGIGSCDDGSRPNRDNFMSYYHCWPAQISDEQSDYIRCTLDNELKPFVSKETNCTGPKMQSCGKCGLQHRECMTGVWSAWGSCIEGTCNSPCSGKPDGKYCGTTLTGYTGAGSDLVICSSANVAGTATCSNGCQVNQPAANDACKSSPCTTYYVDQDGDGHGDRSQPGSCLSSPAAPYTATINDDCNDTDREVYPSHPEWWDIRDNNCNGQIDEVGLMKYDRWHKEWGTEDWEHRFAAASPGAGWTNEAPRGVQLYPADICSGTYRSATCTLLSGGAYAEVRTGMQLPALGECSGQYVSRPGMKHITLYVLEDSASNEYRDYQKEPGFTCRRIGYVLSNPAALALPSSKTFQRLRSTFNPGGKSDNLWSTSTAEIGTHSDYKYGVNAEDINHWRAPDGN